MTRNCLNVMRKVASNPQLRRLTRGAGVGLLGTSNNLSPGMGYQGLMRYLSNSPAMTYARRAGRAAYNTMMGGIPMAAGRAAYNTMTGGVPTATATPAAPRSQVMHNAPTGKELYDAQEQVDARRAKSGLPAVENQYNGPVAALKYNPAVRNGVAQALLDQSVGMWAKGLREYK